MLIFPAIDLYEGKVVRLRRGDYREMTVYSEHPEEVAAGFRAAGAQWLHTVDLQGARDGTTPNFAVIEKLANSGLQVEVGGGIRSEEVIRRYFDAGVSRVILGTAAVADPDFTAAMAAKYPDVAVGVDIRDGQVAVKGWTELSGDYGVFCERLQQLGIKPLIVTDISRDGLLGGSNHALYQAMTERFAFQLIASGGVSSLADVTALAGLNLYGAIIGKALYSGDIDLRAAITAAEEKVC